MAIFFGIIFGVIVVALTRNSSARKKLDSKIYKKMWGKDMPD